MTTTTRERPASSTISRLQGHASKLLRDIAKAQLDGAIAARRSTGPLGSTQRLLARIVAGTTSASRSLPIRCWPDSVEQRWRENRELIVGDLPVRSARIARGGDQGEWGTSWTIDLELAAPLPRRAAQLLAGKAVRRLKALAETGEIPTTARNPAYRSDAGEGQRNVQEVAV